MSVITMSAGQFTSPALCLAFRDAYFRVIPLAAGSALLTRAVCSMGYVKLTWSGPGCIHNLSSLLSFTCIIKVSYRILSPY